MIAIVVLQWLFCMNQNDKGLSRRLRMHGSVEKFVSEDLVTGRLSKIISPNVDDQLFFQLANDIPSSRVRFDIFEKI